jgi:hypothetical protein
MGTLTGGQMYNQILDLLGRTQQDIPAAVANVWLNWSLIHLTDPRVYVHRELIEENTQLLSTGLGNYSIAGSNLTVTRAMDSVVIKNPNINSQRYLLWPIREKDQFEITGIYPPNLPRWYSWLPGGTAIDIISAPGATYNNWELHIRRIIYPGAMQIDAFPNLTSVIQPAWDEVLVLGAVWRGWRDRLDYARADTMKKETGQMINEIAERLKQEAKDTDWGPQVRYVDETMVW